jgi:hypothetical protein
MGAEEGILYADCNLEVAINMKLRHDFAGHYNRPDIFQLQVNRGTPRLYTVVGTEEPQALGGSMHTPSLPASERRATLATPLKQLPAPGHASPARRGRQGSRKGGTRKKNGKGRRSGPHIP